MDTQKIGRFRVDAVVEVAGPTRPTWLLPAATPEALAAMGTSPGAGVTVIEPWS